jgi:hypothetical protein
MRGALLCLALCAGCYPWVGGRWADYELPDEVQLVAVATQTEWLGGYWGDPPPEAELWIGWLPQPEPGTTALEVLSPEGAGCHRGEPSEASLTARLGEPGAASVTLLGPERYTLPWVGQRQRFELSTSLLPSGSYALEPVDTAHGGTLQADPLLALPPGVAVEGPPMSGQLVQSGALEDLIFTWEPATGAADWFFVEVRLSELGPTGFVPYEWVHCLVPFTEGVVEVPPVLWTDPGRGDAVYVFSGPVDESLGPVGERPIAASGFGLARSAGILRL